jgi:hypothetical protein
MKHLLFFMLITTPFSAHGMWPWSTPPTNPAKKPQELQPIPTAQHAISPSAGAPITINVNVAPTQTTTTSSSAASDAKTTTNTTVDTQTQLHSYLKSCVEYTQHMQTHCIQYKYYLIAALCVTLYAYLCYEYVQGNMFLSGNKLWSCFKQDLSLEDLCNFDSNALTDELLRSLHIRYITEKDPLNALEPMAMFLHEIEAERKKLHYYNQLYSWAKLLRATTLLPAKATLYDTIPSRLERLAFIKHVFVTWTCQVKLKRQMAE